MLNSPQTEYLLTVMRTETEGRATPNNSNLSWEHMWGDRFFVTLQAPMSVNDCESAMSIDFGVTSKS